MSSNKALSVSSDRPLSIEELLALSTVTWHPTRHGATSYMRATENLYQQALVYQAEGDLQTYVTRTRSWGTEMTPLD